MKNNQFNKIKRAHGTFSLMLAALFLCLSMGEACAKPNYDRALSIIRTADQTSISFKTAFAQTPSQQATGLMFQRVLEEDKAMLFFFEKTKIATFWMKNTFIPLDIIFINDQKLITEIHENAVPMDETVIQSKYPTDYVLEIQGGLSKKINIKTGDKIEFNNAP